MTINIGERRIGPGHPAFIIAEGCDNHLGDVSVAMEMALRAKLAGADAIKFQHHLPDEEMLADVPMSANFDVPLYDFLLQHALTIDEHATLQTYCRSIGIQYLCTPFSWKAAQELDEIGVDAFKIGSGEMTDVPTLVRIADLGKPMLVSTGMSTFEEIDRTYAALTKRGAALALFNCVSEYPPKYEDINLRVIEAMRERYPDAVIGHSDHTPDLFTSFAAVTLGACAVEKHVIIDKRQPGPDRMVSIDFPELAQLVDGIRKVEAALGHQKRVHDEELAIRAWAFRSLVTTRAVREGEMISDDAVWSKRPGTGIPAHRMDEVIGRRALHDIEANVLIAWDDLA